MDYINLIGSIAAICTTGSFVPQAIKTIRTRDTKSISLISYTVFVIGGFLWLTYGMITNQFPIIISNVITLILTSTILLLKIRYG